MTDRPILFSAPMVRALLDGRKTQTRRIVKVETTDTGWFHLKNGGGGCFCDSEEDLKRVAVDYTPFTVGDRLWVKETHTCVGDGDRWTLYRASGYEAECDRHGFDKPYPPESDVRWKPSIFMRRAISRLTLIVTDVRIERLHAITESDAQAEGADQLVMDDSGSFYSGFPEGTYRCGFAGIWSNINGAESWEANPWVVAVSFDVIKGNIDG